MKKTILGLVVACLVVAAPAKAEETRITNEFATVKACSKMLKSRALPDLDIVSSASVKDTGKKLEVELSWTEDGMKCTGWDWFNYDGSQASCDTCEELPPGGDYACACAVMSCTTPIGKTEVKWAPVRQ